MLQAAMRDNITAVSIGATETDEHGHKYRILAICSEHDEEIEIRLPIRPDGVQTIGLLGDAAEIADLNP